MPATAEPEVRPVGPHALGRRSSTVNPVFSQGGTLSNLAGWILSLVIAAGVLVMDPAGWSPFGPAKWTSVVVVALLGSAAVLARGRVSLERRSALVWVGFAAWVSLAALFGLDRRLGWMGTPQRHFGALTWMLCGAMFIAGQNLGRPGGVRSVIGVSVLVTGACGGWSLAEWLGWQPVRLAGNPRLAGPLGSASYLGAAMALLVPVAIGVALDRSWSRRWRWVSWACGGLGVFALVGSGARAAWVGGLVAVAVVVGANPGRIRAQILRRRVLLIVVGLIVGIVGLAFATGTAARVTAPFESETVGGFSRVAEWETAAKVLADHPLVGVGPEGYRIAFGEVVSATYQRDYGRNPLPDRAHDSLLDVAVTLGLPGLVIYIGLLVVVARFIGRALRRGPPWLIGVAAGLVAYTCGELFLFPVAELEPSAWLLAGLVVTLTASAGEQAVVAAPRLLGPVVASVAALALVIGVRAVMADQQMKGALVLAGNPARASVLAAHSVDLDPDNIVDRLAAAEIDASSGSLTGVDAGLAQISAAMAVSPNDPVLGDEGASLLLQRAQLTGSWSDWESSLVALKAVVRNDPRNPAELLPLGIAEAHQGYQSRAVADWTLASFLAPRSAAPDADLAVLYQEQGQVAAAKKAALDALHIDGSDPAAQHVLEEQQGNGT